MGQGKLVLIRQCVQISLALSVPTSGLIQNQYLRAGRDGNDGQRIENAMAKIVDIENNVKQDIEIQLLAINEIHCLMAMIDDPLLKLLLHKRYLLYEKWDEIAVDLNYRWKQIHRLHDKALNIIVNKM